MNSLIRIVDFDLTAHVGTVCSRSTMFNILSALSDTLLYCKTRQLQLRRIEEIISGVLFRVSLFYPLKRQTKIAADDILIFYFYLSKKIKLDFSCESSVRQRIHLKHQTLFSLKNNEKMFMNVVCCSRDWRFKV